MKLALLAGIAAASLVHTAAPSRMQIVAREYSFTFSRIHLRAGTELVELDNFGQDLHDLRVQRVGSRHIAGLGVVPPGGRGTLTVKLTPGRYSFWCAVGDHRRLGMQATLIVTR